LTGDIRFGINDLSLRNIDTIGAPLSIMKVTTDEPYYLNNSMSIGVGDRAMEISFIVDLFVDFERGGLGENLPLNDKMEITVRINDLRVMINGIYKMLQSRLNSFSPLDVADSNCLLSLFQTPEVNFRGLRLASIDPSFIITLLAMSIEELDVDIRCIECSSPVLKELEEQLLLPESSNQVTHTVNSLMDFIIEKAGDQFIYDQIDRMMVDSSKQCKSNQDYDSNFAGTSYKRLPKPKFDVEYPGLTVITYVLGILVLIFAVFEVTMKCVMRKRHDRWLKTLNSSELSFYEREDRMKKTVEDHIDLTTTSMIRNKDIPWLIRYSMPVIVVINILLFISGHLSLAGGVGMTFDLAGDSIKVSGMKTLSIGGTTQILWRMGLYIPAIMIGAFSIVWPYLKQLVNLFLWILPPTKLPTSFRGSVLLWLDILGKWSIVDVFIMIVLIIGLRSSIFSPRLDFLPDDLYKIDLYVTPMWGMYANTIAQILSQICSHVYIHYHRKIVNGAKKKFTVAANDTSSTSGETPFIKYDNETPLDSKINKNDGKTTPTIEFEDGNDDDVFKERLCCYGFYRTHINEKNKDERLVPNKNVVDRGMIVAAIAILFLNVLVFVVPIFYMDSIGIYGLLTEAGRASRSSVDKFTITHFFTIFYEQAKYLDYWHESIGLLFLGSLFIWSVILVPILLTMLLLRLWFIPMTKKQRRKMLILVEILVAWEYSEVFIFAVILQVWQTEQITSTFINHFCRGLNEEFRTLVYYDIMKPEDTQCYTRTASMSTGTFIMLGSVVILMLMTVFVTRATKQYLREAEMFLPYEEENHMDSCEKTLTDIDENSNSDDDTKIKQFPAQFTDTYLIVLDVQQYQNIRNIIA